MESLLFSMNATVPVALMILTGYVLKRVGIMTPAFTEALNHFTYSVTLPFMLFSNMRTAQFRDLWDPVYLLFCMAVTLLCFCLIAAVSLLLIRKNRPLRGEFIQGSFRGSAVLLAFAYIQNLYGVVTTTSLMVIAAVPLYNLLSAALLSLTAPRQAGPNHSILRQTAKNLLRNPVVIGVAVGLAGSLLQPSLPEPVERVISNLSALTSPLALLCLGAAFQWSDVKSTARLTGVGACIKLLLLPALLLPAALALGLTGEKLAAILIMLGSPTSVTSYVMARNANHRGALTASLIVVTTIFSTVTLTLWLYLLRLRGLL